MHNRPSLTRSLAAGLAVAGMLAVAAFVWDATPGEGDGTLILLLLDGPLTSESVSSTPPLELAGHEVLLNAAIVPEVTIQSGLLMRPLYTDSVGRSSSVVAWPDDISLRRHWHPVTERLWMIEGSIASPADGEVGSGMFWGAPPESAMGPFTSTGSVFVFLGEGPFETHYLHTVEEAPRAGETYAVDPDTLSWRPFAAILGPNVNGQVKRLSPQTETDRAVYLVRLDEAGPVPYSVFGANLEGYVLSGSLRMSDPYHGTHLLEPGFYFRIPAGFPLSLSAASESAIESPS
jgi:hypothetical protein